MLEVGWTELILIMAIAVMVVGPSEIPTLMVGLGRLVRRITYVKYAFSQQFEEFMKQADMDDLASSVNFETSITKKVSQDQTAKEDKPAPAQAFDEAAADEDGDYIPPHDEVDVLQSEGDEPYREPVLDGGEKMP